MSIPSVLIIEDNIGDVYLLRHGLDQCREPYQLHVLSDGEAALRFVDEHRTGVREHLPCIILLDLHLPKYNGIEILTAIKQAPAMQHLQVVVFSSIISPAELARLTQLGAICRTKPVMLPEYAELARDILELCRRAGNQRVTEAVTS